MLVFFSELKKQEQRFIPLTKSCTQLLTSPYWPVWSANHHKISLIRYNKCSPQNICQEKSSRKDCVNLAALEEETNVSALAAYDCL